MRGAHRRLHVLAWAVVVAAVAFGVAAAIGARPVDPLTELPAAVAAESP